MHNITLICTRHEETGNCNANELCKIIASINPEIIFEELSQANFDRSYKEERLFTLETNAIKMYLQSCDIKHIPVDTFNITRAHEEQHDNMYQRICSYNKTIERYDYRSATDELFQRAAYYGFSFLNSDHNDALFEKIRMLEEKILTLLNDERLFRVNDLRKEVIGKREDEIIQNVYNYSREHDYNQAILFIGSGHRKSMLEKIKVCEMHEHLKLNWSWVGK